MGGTLLNLSEPHNKARDGYSHYSHFADEKTDAQAATNKEWSQDWNPGSPVLSPCS